MICPHCHAENREGAKFCDECGTRLVPSVDEAAPQGEIPAANETEAVSQQEPASEQEHRSSCNEEAAPDEMRPENEGEEEDARSAEADEPLEHVDVIGPDVDPDEQDGGAAESELPASPDETHVIAERKDAPVSEASQTRKIDLSGFDEYLPAGSYVPPSPSWRDGGTMRMPRIDEDAGSSDQKSFRAPEEKAKRHLGLKIVLGVVVALAICGALAAFATYQMELWGGKVVPDVVGMTQADATNTLESKGFSVRSTQVKSDETEGVVLLMDPGSGSRADEGAEIVIHVATARVIPTIVGSARADAESAISAEGLENVSYTTQRSDESEGTVLSVDPSEGEKVNSNTAVTVVVAEPYRVPDVAGMTQSDAAAAMEQAGYSSHVVYIYDEDVAEGSVLGSDPVAGTVVPSGSDVAIQVALSRGTELVGATQSLLAPGTTIVIDGVNYDIASCDSVTYQGNETTAYSITASPFTYFLGVKLPLEARSVSGTITWNADNSIASSSPAITFG